MGFLIVAVAQSISYIYRTDDIGNKNRVLIIEKKDKGQR